MLYEENAVRANVRNRDGKRVFFLGKEDRLTPSARDYLSRERIEILSAEQARPERYRLPGGGYMEEKPEHMTHLNRETLVRKDHPRIRFRGAMDTLEAQLLLTGAGCARLQPELDQILSLARRLIRCDVLKEPVGDFSLCGLTEAQQRQHSHFPQEHYKQPHFMPGFGDGQAILQLNLCRTAAREAELWGVTAFSDAEGLPLRPDILQALNRMSSMLYILMIREKAKQ